MKKFKVDVLRTSTEIISITVEAPHKSEAIIRALETAPYEDWAGADEIDDVSYDEGEVKEIGLRPFPREKEVS